jgi:hypothetical protein
VLPASFLLRLLRLLLLLLLLLLLCWQRHMVYSCSSNTTVQYYCTAVHVPGMPRNS